MTTDEQWSRAMDYVSKVSELNYMTQIVIMLYEDPTKVPVLVQVLTDMLCLRCSYHIKLLALTIKGVA